MHCLRIGVRRSRSFDLGSSFFTFQAGLTAFGFFPHVTAQSVDWLCNSVLTCFLLSSKLFPYLLSYCGYMLLFHCLNSMPSWPSEIE